MNEYSSYAKCNIVLVLLLFAPHCCFLLSCLSIDYVQPAYDKEMQQEKFDELSYEIVECPTDNKKYSCFRVDLNFLLEGVRSKIACIFLQLFSKIADVEVQHKTCADHLF